VSRFATSISHVMTVVRFEDVDGVTILKFAVMLALPTASTLILALHHHQHQFLLPPSVNLMEELLLEECFSLLELPSLLLELICFTDGEREESLIIENSSNLRNWN